MKLKLAWFSPLVPVHSDIANYTERLEAELQRHFEVRFLTEMPNGFHEPATGKLYPAEIDRIPQELLLSLSEVDLPIYNLGNNPTYFSRTWFLSQRRAGVVILHDLKLHHFFEGIYRERLGDRERYLALMDEYYGGVGVEAGTAYWEQELSIDFMAEHFPMTAWAVRNALAVVVHTPHALEAVRDETKAPVYQSLLPYDAHASLHPLPGAGTERRATFSPEQPARVVIFGYLNVNRRVGEFLEALAAMDERGCFEVHLIGELWQRYDEEVRATVARLGLQDRVVFHGYVPEDELDRLLSRSELAINLRFPTMGESSGSLLRIWDHALPCLVTEVGGYANLPADVVSFVRPEHEAADIQRHLRDFLADPDEFRRRGARGRQRLLEHHLPSAYVEKFRLICDQIPELRARHSRFAMASRVAAAIAPWSEGGPAISGAHHYAACISGAFQ